MSVEVFFITFFHENFDYKEALVKSKRAMKGHFFKVLFLLMINGFFLSLVTDVILTSMTLFSQSVIGFVIYLLGLSLILQDYLQEGFDLGGGNISITAHRGNGYYYPENSLEGINQAFFSESDYVEIDVQLSKDKVPILLHDKSFSRATGVNKRPDEMTLEEIKSLDGGIYLGEEFKNTKIPTLEEVIKEFHGRTKLNIELKPYSQDPKELSRIVVNLVKKNKFEN